MSDPRVEVYRKKPGLVHARRVTEHEDVPTAHGPVPAEPGDWVLTQPETGDTWPIKDAMFQERYELDTPASSDVRVEAERLLCHEYDWTPGFHGRACAAGDLRVVDRVATALADAARERARELVPDGDWCTVCHAPQWVFPDGRHGCATMDELREENDRLTSRLAEVERERVNRFTAPIVVMCGSVRFRSTWAAEMARLTDQGFIVLTVGRMLPKAEGEFDPAHKARLDDLHKRKIDLADWVWVLDVGGYIGASTRSEIDYAARIGRLVRYLSHDYPEWVEPPDDVARDETEIAALRQRVEQAERERDSLKLAIEQYRDQIAERMHNESMAALGEWKARAEQAEQQTAGLRDLLKIGRHALFGDRNPEGKTVLDLYNVWLDQAKARAERAERERDTTDRDYREHTETLGQRWEQAARQRDALHEETDHLTTRVTTLTGLLRRARVTLDGSRCKPDAAIACQHCRDLPPLLAEIDAALPRSS